MCVNYKHAKNDKCVDFAVASVTDVQHFRAPANSSLNCEFCCVVGNIGLMDHVVLF